MATQKHVSGGTDEIATDTWIDIVCTYVLRSTGKAQGLDGIDAVECERCNDGLKFFVKFGRAKR